MTTTSNWYVVQVMSSHEKKVKKALEENRANEGMQELVEEVLVPTENVAEVKAGERKVTEKRLWPGYILVRMKLTDESWMYVLNTNGVIGFAGANKQPEALSQTEVEEILNELKDKKEEVVLKHDVVIGDKVKIVDGVFVNFIGDIVDVNQDKGRVSVMVSIFGRDTRVDDLEFWQIEKVTDEA